MQCFKYVRQGKQIETLIEFLARRFQYQPREQWIANIEKGAVRIDGKIVSPNIRLETKMIIGYDRPREDEPPIDTNYEILYEDEEIIVVDKNGNIPIAESGKYYRNTLTYLLKEKEGYPELFAVHRLDRETSGVIVIARKKGIATIMGEQFQKGTPIKTYHAILLGEMEEAEIMVEQPIKKVEQLDDVVRIRQTVNPAGKASKTLFKKISSNGKLTFAEVQLFTGRTHQIRLHAEYIQHPILGDKLYGQKDEDFIAMMKGDKEPVFGEFGRIDRQLLHASSLTFHHPITKKEMTFQSSAEKVFLPYVGVDLFSKDS